MSRTAQLKRIRRIFETEDAEFTKIMSLEDISREAGSGLAGPAAEAGRENGGAGREETEDPGTFTVAPEQAQKYKITALAPSGMGKTVFLSALYHSMILDYQSPLHLRMNEAYLQSGNYASLRDIAILRPDGEIGAFPTGTKETRIYGLTLYGDAEPYCPFEFVDYRGSLVEHALPENEDRYREDAAEQMEIARLRRQLEGSDCLLLFLDAVRVSQYLDADQRRAQCQMLIINRIFTSILKGWERRFDVVALLTKIDDQFVREEDKRDHYRGLVAKAEEICRTVASNCRSFSIIPVSGVGEGRTVTVEIVEDGQRSWRSELKKGICPEPENVALALAHACRLILKKKLEALEAERAQLWPELEEVAGRRLFLPWRRQRQEQELRARIAQLEREIDRTRGQVNRIYEAMKEDFDQYVYMVKGGESEDEI